MELVVSKQVCQLCTSWLAGIALGLIYDIMRVIRQRLNVNAVFDGLFCMAVFFTLFALGMGAGEGSLNVFMLVFFALGITVYMLTLSKTVLTVIRKTEQFFEKCLLPIKKAARSAAEFVSIFFQKQKLKLMMRKKHRKEAKEHETVSVYNGDGARGTDSLRAVWRVFGVRGIGRGEKNRAKPENSDKSDGDGKQPADCKNRKHRHR